MKTLLEWLKDLLLNTYWKVGVITILINIISFFLIFIPLKTKYEKIAKEQETQIRKMEEVVSEANGKLDLIIRLLK